MKRARQSALLYGSELVLLLSGFVASLLVTRLLGPQQYGIYSFVLGFVAFIGLFYEFGLHTTSARLLATTESDQKQRQYIGSFMVLTFGLGCLLAATLLTVAGLKIGIKPEYQAALLFAAPLTVMVPFGFYFENVSQGTNRVSILSAYNSLINVFYLVFIVALQLAHRVTVTAALGGYFSALTISCLIAFVMLRPAGGTFRTDLPAILDLNKRYGIKVFFGRVATVATYNLDKIFLAIFSTPAAVGYYSLAYATAQPLSLLSRSVSFSMFRDFATSPTIPPRVLRFNLLWLVATTTLLTVGGYLLLVPIFTSAYAPAKTLVPVLALAVAFQGLYEPYNKFLVARGEGDRIRRITLSTAAVNLLVNLIFIYYYGAIGAAFASLFSMVVTFALYYIEYHKYISPAIHHPSS